MAEMRGAGHRTLFIGRQVTKNMDCGRPFDSPGPTLESQKRMEIARIVAAHYRKTFDLGFMCVIGSVARGSADAHSDLDLITCFLRPPSAAQHRMGIERLLAEYGNPPQPKTFNQGPVEGFRIQDVEVSIFWGQPEEFVEIPKNRDRLMGTDGETNIAVYQDAITLFDPLEIWRKVRDQLAAYPVDAGARIIRSQIEQIVFLLEGRFQKAIRSGSPLVFHELRCAMIDSLLRLLFALNRQYLRRLSDLPAVAQSLAYAPDGCVEGFSALVGMGSASQFWNASMRLLSELANIIPKTYPDLELDATTEQLLRGMTALSLAEV